MGGRRLLEGSLLGTKGSVLVGGQLWVAEPLEGLFWEGN